MNITEANKVALLIRFATGQPAGTPDQIRDAITDLAQRASKPLQLQVRVDPHDLDAAIARHQKEAHA